MPAHTAISGEAEARARSGGIVAFDCTAASARNHAHRRMRTQQRLLRVRASSDSACAGVCVCASAGVCTRACLPVCVRACVCLWARESTGPRSCGRVSTHQYGRSMCARLASIESGSAIAHGSRERRRLKRQHEPFELQRSESRSKLAAARACTGSAGASASATGSSSRAAAAGTGAKGWPRDPQPARSARKAGGRIISRWSTHASTREAYFPPRPQIPHFWLRRAYLTLPGQLSACPNPDELHTPTDRSPGRRSPGGGSGGRWRRCPRSTAPCGATPW